MDGIKLRKSFSQGCFLNCLDTEQMCSDVCRRCCWAGARAAGWEDSGPGASSLSAGSGIRVLSTWVLQLTRLLGYCLSPFPGSPIVFLPFRVKQIHDCLFRLPGASRFLPTQCSTLTLNIIYYALIFASCRTDPVLRAVSSFTFVVPLCECSHDVETNIITLQLRRLRPTECKPHAQVYAPGTWQSWE